ncbi:MAG TPA: hypothetical protein VGT03_16430 [Candidatus Acidoferrales bacterium]|nr:hypothetical protein [Candidatus Acidoferrales bacterium]
MAVICSCLLVGGSFGGASAARPNAIRVAQQQIDSAKKIKDRLIRWDPPNLDGPLGSVSASPPCTLSHVLEQAGARAQEMMDNIPNFTANERIQYQATDPIGQLEQAQSGTFEYVALFSSDGTGWTVQEYRTPLKGTETFPASAQDIGLPELALIFLPRYQADFDMTCEGAAQWNGEAAWVVHFRQRPDKPSEMLSIPGTKPLYRLKLKGRAWLAADSGEVLHLDTGILGAIPALRVRNWWLSINYGPVQFRSLKIRMWLPQTVDASTEFDDHRMMIYHTFADFMVFSVHTQQEIGKPKEPH